MTDGLHRRLAAYAAAVDAEIQRSGALGRVRRNVLQRRPAGIFLDISWRRIAAAILVAGMLGGAIDLMLPDRQADSFDVAIVDPLYALDGTDGQ
jgi:hypothetical protein